MITATYKRHTVEIVDACAATQTATITVPNDLAVPSWTHGGWAYDTTYRVSQSSLSDIRQQEEPVDDDPLGVEIDDDPYAEFFAVDSHLDDSDYTSDIDYEALGGF